MCLLEILWLEAARRTERHPPAEPGGGLPAASQNAQPANSCAWACPSPAQVPRRTPGCFLPKLGRASGSGLFGRRFPSRSIEGSADDLRASDGAEPKSVKARTEEHVFTPVTRHVADLTARYANLDGVALLRALIEREFAGRLAVVSSFGAGIAP